MKLPQPYLLFLGDVTVAPFAKTAFGLRDWAPDSCVGEFVLPAATITAGLPRLSMVEARERGARAVVIGVANIGGALKPDWIASLAEGLEAGLDVISGMHSLLEDVPELALAAARHGRRLINVRRPPENIPIASGARRAGRRLLTVGTDCAVGKKYTALTLAREFGRRGVRADFRATGQTGILIAGSGIPIDAVVSDFVAGAAEMLSPAADASHWDVVEGQGSIFHPAYAGVSLGLLHGTQPDVIVMCHEVGRDRIMGMDSYATPSVAEAIELTLRLARRTNPGVRCGGVALNTSRLSGDDAATALERCSREVGLPVADPIRGGTQLAQLVAGCLK